jgi:hypothetical protein
MPGVLQEVDAALAQCQEAVASMSPSWLGCLLGCLQLATLQLVPVQMDDAAVTQQNDVPCHDDVLAAYEAAAYEELHGLNQSSVACASCFEESPSHQIQRQQLLLHGSKRLVVLCKVLLNGRQRTAGAPQRRKAAKRRRANSNVCIEQGAVHPFWLVGCRGMLLRCVSRHHQQ